MGLRVGVYQYGELSGPWPCRYDGPGPKDEDRGLKSEGWGVESKV